MPLRIFVWILFIITSAFALASIAVYSIGYSLLTPHSGIIHTGAVLFWWKVLLASAILSGSIFITHFILVGKTLWRGDLRRALERSLAFLIVLGGLLLVHLAH